VSYILEALRRSERERQRTAPPSIHISHAMQHEGMPHTPPGLLKWMAVVLLAGTAITAVLLWSPVGAKLRSHSITAPADQAGMPPKPPLTRPGMPAPLATPSHAPATTRTLHPSIAVQSISPATHTNTTMPQQPVGDRQAKAPLRPQAVTRKTSLAAPVKQTDTHPASAISQLPANLQNTLPSISIAGHIYADAPDSRMVMINGKITHEGDAVASGLTLETITPDGIILKFQGTRFHMSVFQHWPPGG